MPTNHREIAFEDAIEAHLLDHGYLSVPKTTYDPKLALFPAEFFAFIAETQPAVWEGLRKHHAAGLEPAVLDALVKALDTRGTVDVLRHGFKFFGKLLRVAYFAPAHGLNPETEALYRKNRLAVTRQVCFKEGSNKSVDMLLSLNGLPVATAELKNPLTGQTVEDARRQYMRDRDPKEKLFEFKVRALVHFAVDPDEVWMTTRLSRDMTRFLPFNMGRGGGAGNPANPNGHSTAYLWEEVWERNSLLDILARFIHLEVKEEIVDGKKIRKESLIFPRYHQLAAVRSLEADARHAGAGTNYLVQHSAGSGKSNTIGWLAHRLASLHDERDEKVFSSVIVITDRLVLDQQLQDTIYQFEHKQGVVRKIDKDSTQLAAALEAGTAIVITTLQKFPFVTGKIGELPERRYAVIIDEAHSSQSGEGAIEMKRVLAAKSLEEAAKQDAGFTEDHEENILRTMLARGRQPNISFFAFTATPKHKTLEVFGHTGPDGKPAPFHLYTMRQAIEEGFILDVLKNYTTYKTYYRLVKAIAEDPEVEKRKAARALARFMSLHPHNLAQKTEVMVEHFQAVTRHLIGGRAKAMVVTGSRLHAVRYKEEFDRYIAAKKYDIRTLVAFSGEVIDPDLPDRKYTEVGMNNGIREKELPERFGSGEYQVLIVAEKYQTGFDQPLLQTMFVDRRLSGVQAVQTLSRLNRTHPGKEETFVLDFVNEAEEIRESFQPYYEQTSVVEVANPQQLYHLQTRLNDSQVYHLSEVESLCRVYFKRAEQSREDHGRLYAHVKPACDRYEALDEEQQEEFKKLLVQYRNLYAFLAQVMPFHDMDLEKLYAFVRFLLLKLPHRQDGGTYHFEDEVALKYYRLQKISEGSLVLEPGGGFVPGPTSVGTGAGKDDTVELSKLIDLLNERFGTEFSQADQLFFDQITEEALLNRRLVDTAQANTLDNFRYVFEHELENLFIGRMDQNGGIFDRFMNDAKFRSAVVGAMMKVVYERARGDSEAMI